MEPTTLPAELGVLVDHVQRYAEEHYNDGGWDVIVECWDRDDIGQELARAGAATPEAALAVFAPCVDVWADRQADARNSAF